MAGDHDDALGLRSKCAERGADSTAAARGDLFHRLPGDNAEVISIRSDGIAVASNTAGSVDVLDLSNPFDPRRLIRVPVDTTTGTPNSAAVHPQLDYFLTVTGRAGQIGRVSAFGLFNGVLLDSAPVGIQPDSVVISPNGLFAVITNEAEGSGVGQNGGAGSLSVVDLGASQSPGRLVVHHLALPSIVGLPGVSAGRTDDLAVLPIDNCPRRRARERRLQPGQPFRLCHAPGE